MKKLLIAAALLSASAFGRAANADGERILQVEGRSLSQMTGAIQACSADAISINVPRATFTAQPAAWHALDQWVRQGGVVFLHTDAADLFGYTTVAARPATARQAGQLFGRARNALPSGAHPLLWGSLQATRQPGHGASPLGVRLVYYEMAVGDVLVVSHPAAVPLLRVTDMAGAGTTPPYAAAMAPYGHGWAVFTPTLVERHRADGALFVQNLFRLVASSSKASKSVKAGLEGGEAFTSISAAAIERTTSADAADFSALAKEIDKGRRPSRPAATEPATPPGAAIPTDPTAPDAAAAAPPAPPPDEALTGPRPYAPGLMLTTGEATAIRAVLATAAGDKAPAPAKARARAAAYLLRARLELQRDQVAQADEALKVAEAAAPGTAETALWRGVLDSGEAEDYTRPSRERAAWLNDAAANWAAAQAGPALEPAPARPSGGTGYAAAPASLCGIPLQMLQAWAGEASAEAALVATEPPLVGPVADARSVVLRFWDDDPGLRLALPTADLLAKASKALGWRVDEEEILLFPTPEAFGAYRANAGLGQPIPDAQVSTGDVNGSRLLLVSQVTQPVILPGGPGRPRRVVQFGAALPAVMARLHAHALISSLAEGGTAVPMWMTLGLSGLSDLYIESDLSDANISVEALRPFAAANSLLSPEQFRNYAGNTTATPGLAEAQAVRLMTFFYARFGAGAVAETLQRLGAGETAEQAMEATTNMTQQQFFEAWVAADFP